MDEQRTHHDLEVKLSGRRVSSETTAICAGPDVLTIVTALPGPRRPVRAHLDLRRPRGSRYPRHAPRARPARRGRGHRNRRAPSRAAGPRGTFQGDAPTSTSTSSMEHLRRLGPEPAVDLPDDASGPGARRALNAGHFSTDIAGVAQTQKDLTGVCSPGLQTTNIMGWPKGSAPRRQVLGRTARRSRSVT